MALIENWHIRSRAKECAATQRAFADGETIVAAIFPDPESSGYLRRDFTVDAWRARDGAAEVPFSFWRTTFVLPPSEERPEVVRKESAEELFRRLVDENEEHTENVRYILAVMLERQKVLRETDNQRTPIGILRVYEHRRAGDVFLVRDPDIPLSRVDSVQEDIVRMLESGGRLEVPVEEVAEVPAAEAAGGEASLVDGSSPEPSGEEVAAEDPGGPEDPAG